MVASFRTRLRPGRMGLSLAICIGLAGSELLSFPNRAVACPFCSAATSTLTREVDQASMVLFGTLTNAKLNAEAFDQGTTDLQIETIIKKNDILGDKKVVTVPRYIPTDKNTKYLLFCDVYKGKIDPFRAISVKGNGDMVKYLQGAMAVKDKNVSTRLRFFFDFLDNADLEIA